MALTRDQSGTNHRAIRAQVTRWAGMDLPTLTDELLRWGWQQPQLTPDGQQLSITGPSQIRITLWAGLERSTTITQLSLGWLGPLGVITDK
jgi:hypothetical protein